MGFTRRQMLSGFTGTTLATLLGSHTAWSHGKNNTGFTCGINCSGLEDTPPGIPTSEMLHYYASQGVRHIRLPGLWEHFQPRLGADLDTDYCHIYRSIIEQCKTLKINVICEPCHNYGHYQQMGQDLCFGDGNLKADLFADFWKRFIQSFGGLSNIAGWDLMGEPSNLPGASIAQQGLAWQDAAQAAIIAIRQTGERRPVWVEGYGHSSAASWPVNNPTLHLLQDPLGRLVFSAHGYLDRDNSGTHYYWDEEIAIGDQVSGGALTTNIGIKRLTPFLKWLRTHKLKGNIGECGAGRQDRPGAQDDTGWLTALETTMRFCYDQNIPFYYWGTGKDLGPAYPYGLEIDNGKAAPQWNILKKYL
ncbi:hypothetical protein JCM25156A_31290 [Komagataeibacter kakiaceti JCM 25156]|uniref:glycoside hydrolase family 5 protein n=1 Tax=Komagataeibacter kakiaceti TaxID=943261 RepID=UPI000A013157|nr:cellulase family glycosylhydrolase [Komagataeibacter kakiaceti]